MMAETQNMTLEEVIQKLQESFTEVQDTIADLNEAQVAFKANEDTWSIAENLEHMVMTNQGILMGIQNISETTTKLPAMSTDKVMDMMANGTFKVKSPPMVLPEGKKTWEMLKEEFDSSQRGIIDFFENSERNWEDIFFPHPVIGELNALNWLGFIAGHNIRHGKQIQEVMKVEDFPN